MGCRCMAQQRFDLPWRDDCSRCTHDPRPTHPHSAASTAGPGSCPATSRAHATISASAEGSSKDLLVVGMGTLGAFLGRAWREEHGPGAAVYGETSSAARHEELRRLGVVPTVRADRGASKRGDFRT